MHSRSGSSQQSTKLLFDVSGRKCSDQRQCHTIYWKTPTGMLCALLLATCTAIAHHIFYAHLAGSEVPASSVALFMGFHASQQQINVAAGTSLAFFVKTCLVMAAGLAYVQLFWRAIHRKDIPLDSLDTLHTAYSNVLTIYKVKTWQKHPLMLLLAIQIWLLPIASVITPAVLTVELVLSTTTRDMTVPSIDFDSLKFVTPGQMAFSGPDEEGPMIMEYSKPTYKVQRLIQNTATSGSILEMNHVPTNSSWRLSFAGPYLKCGDVDPGLLRDIESNLEFATPHLSSVPFYVAWTPLADGSNTEPINRMPYSNSTRLNNSTISELNIQTLGPLVDNEPILKVTLNASQAATIHFAILPESPVPANATYLQCQLYNTSYDASFSLTNGKQSTSLAFPNLSSAIPVEPLTRYYLWNGRDGCTMVNAFTSCTVDPFTLQRLSFQSIMDAFGQTFVGSISTPSVTGNNEPYHSSYTSYVTSLLSTSLVDAPELAFIFQGEYFLQSQYGPFLIANASAEFDSLLDWNTTNRNQTFRSLIEQLFQNMTISLLSDAYFHPNSSSPFTPGPVAVSISSPNPVYTYSARILWLSYGLAIGSTCVSILVGFATMHREGNGAFSNELSTVLRATRNAHISVEIEGDDTGSDPLPERLKKATLGITKSASTGEE